MESEPITPKGKIPSTGGSEESRTSNATSCGTVNPTLYQLSYSRPQESGVESQVCCSQGRYLNRSATVVVSVRRPEHLSACPVDREGNTSLALFIHYHRALGDSHYHYQSFSASGDVPQVREYADGKINRGVVERADWASLVLVSCEC